MSRVLRTLFSVAFLCSSVTSQDAQDRNDDGYFYGREGYRNTLGTELSGGTLTGETIVLAKSGSPYWLRNDIIVERDAELVIEQGVEIKVDPQVGITVRGILSAAGTEFEPITLTTSDDRLIQPRVKQDIRLVDGPSILAGRVQLRHKGKWRNVCTNSKKWSLADMETACRQMGFQGGSFFIWYDRQMPLKPRLLYEIPDCIGIESSLFNCSWSTRQLGSGVCDYHPDIGIQCQARHDKSLPSWRGIRFESAKYSDVLTLYNTLYIPTSLSTLSNVRILYAGAGRNQNTSSALHIEGVPPVINNLEISNSAYNAINVTNPEAPVTINNCTLENNRGYGIFINSSYGLVKLEGCVISENGADGVRYVRSEQRLEEKVDRTGYSDFCRIAISSSQTFPVQMYAEQTIYSNKEKFCDKVFTTRYGHVITLNVIRAVMERNNSASLEIYDGSDFSHRLIKSFDLRNNTRPQSITSISNKIYIKFRADMLTNIVVFMRLFSGMDKAFDLNVTSSDISANEGRGIAVDNLRSQVHIHKSNVTRNEHVAGLHVTSGVGDINVTESRISYNEADGINVTYTAGCRNISRSSVSSNKGYGFALWLNDTRETEYVFVNQTTVVQYSAIYSNLNTGILHGNYCGPSFFNFSGNMFLQSRSDALEILTCWKNSDESTRLQIGHNRFLDNDKIGIRISPAVNLRAMIEHNQFERGSYGAIFIRNKLLEEFFVLPTDIRIQQNYFLNNTGIYVVNLALSPYSTSQYLLFTRNFVKNNQISEPFQPDDGSVSKLNPRGRVAAPVVAGSDNVEVFRNIIENPNSKYEIGSHLEDQSKIINCTFNWLGSHNDEKIINRIFHRYDRYNLARILFIPFLIHNSNPLTNKINDRQWYVPRFININSNKIGGEIEGEEVLYRGEYVVEKDISIRPGGKLTIESGVSLKFPPAIGMMIGGRLEAKGIEPNSILFTIKEEILHPPDNETYDTESLTGYDSETEVIEIEPSKPLRLIGGKTELEGRLQVKINNQWGTVCNYKWTIKNAALVCHQLGFVLNPDDWFLERNEIPNAGREDRVILTNVDCDDHDLDITKCRSEFIDDFENSCDHEHDVGLRCYKTSWAGLRFGATAERTNIQYITIEQAGLLDYATNSFKPALQLDFARQNFESIRISDNFYHGFGVLYSDIYTDDQVNTIKNSEFINNKGAGITMKQLGFTVFSSTIENNYFGIHHDPTLSGLQQREFAGWFKTQHEDNHYNPSVIPAFPDKDIIFVKRGETKYFVTSPVQDNQIRSYKIQCDPGWVLGIQLLNPMENRSTEQISIHDSLSYNSKSSIWLLKRDLSVFPTTSSSHGIILDYSSGENAIGGMVIVISTIRAPKQIVYNRIVKGPVPTLKIQRCRIRNNNFGIHASYYNRYLNELGDHFLRKANESIIILNSEISHNLNEAIFVHSPHWDLHRSNISEVTIMINNSLITDNGKGIYHFSRDMRASNNLFHYILQDDTIERNKAVGFDLRLPYVWQYNENFTHSIYMDNNTWANNNKFSISIDGHFSVVNITQSRFIDNKCTDGLVSFRGMEKKLRIKNNKFVNNNGRFVIEFSINSQAEIIGDVPAIFAQNELIGNSHRIFGRSFGTLQIDKDPTTTIRFKGIQKVAINRNLFTDNTLDYQLVAGIKTAKTNNFLDVRENWWDTRSEDIIKRSIFDFNDWNNHAIAQFTPYLLENRFDSSFSISHLQNTSMDLNNLGGMLHYDFVIPARDEPYIVTADITVMPTAKLIIQPGVILEFAPNVGILVLGSITAAGYRDSPIIMRPWRRIQNIIEDDRNNRVIRSIEMVTQDSIRLFNPKTFDTEIGKTNEGFLEYFNKTTLQWIPMCDPRFTERNAQVVCKELGFNPLNVFFDHDVRREFHSNSLSRIWTWPEPLQCKGSENRYENCPIRLNGQQFGHRHECKWNSKFVFINCGPKNLKGQDYWGGIRFAFPDFEKDPYLNKAHDIYHHSHQLQPVESVLEFLNIIGAGILHNEKSPALLGIIKCPKVSFVSISQSAYHGINLISPAGTVNLLGNEISDSLGSGINILSMTGEDRESDESSFIPLEDLNIPYNLFSLIDICDTQKEIIIEERIVVYYKYDNSPVNCVKIFRSIYEVKPLGFRLLQFNLFSSPNTYSFELPDFISIYDGDVYNTTSKLLGRITTKSGNEKKMFKTKQPSMSIKLFANGASSNYGFFAEVFVLPVPALGFNRDVQHNVSHSVFENNREGGITYRSVGEVNPIITIERNQFKRNGQKLYGNFTTCKAAIDMDIQNTQTVYFRNNLVQNNEGGLWIRSDSRSSATSLKAWIHNNLFVNNTNLPSLYVEGRNPSPYQEATIFRNYFTRNYAIYNNNIVLKQVISNFTWNYVKRNIGLQNLEMSGFDAVRLPYMSTSHNGFYNNFAVYRDGRSTILAGTAGQQFIHNIFFNPDNDYEMVTVNKSFTVHRLQTKIEATDNYWGFNTSLAVRGRIKDQRDDPRLLEVNYTPYFMNNETILSNKKCPPGWSLIGETCYMYIGAPMSYDEAKQFCKDDNASMPYLLGSLNYYDLFNFLQTQDERFVYGGKVWVQHIDMINQCTMFVYQSVEIHDCEERRPFICEIDPKVTIRLLPLANDIITISVLSSASVAIILLIIVGICWWNKSKYRQAQRLERRNSIRQSLHSLRSVGLAPSTYSDASFRRKNTQMSTRSTDTLTKNSDYKKILSTGSFDSMEKSVYDSSVEDTQSYEAFESNPNPSSFVYNPTITYHKSPKRLENTYAQPNTFDLAFKNEGFRDNSTFASNSNYQSRAESVQDGTTNDETPIIRDNSGNSISSPPSDYYNTDTLPLGGHLDKSDSTLDLKHSIEEANRNYDPSYSRQRPNIGYMHELKAKLPQNNEQLSSNPTDHSSAFSKGLEDLKYSPDFHTVGLPHSDRPQSTGLLESDFDESKMRPPKPKSRSKSEALLETNFDYIPSQDSPMIIKPFSDQSRSQSQPLETAM